MGSRVVVMFLMTVLLSTTTSLALDDSGDIRTQNVAMTSLTMMENPQLCQLCEEFTMEALFYLNENETQTEIISTLHQACSKFPSFNLECARLVDYYAPLFFTKISSLSPDEFYVSVSFCEEVTLIRLPRHEHTCTLCHEVVDEVITNLEDPDMEILGFDPAITLIPHCASPREDQSLLLRALKIIEILLKGCNNTDNFVQKCKRLIIQNTPVILEEIKKYLKKKDFCNSIHVCGGKKVLRSLSTASTSRTV